MTSPENILEFLLDPKAEDSMVMVREMIFIAEDTQFTVEQCMKLSPWLLSFAEKYRDSDNQKDEGAVWSAIRTGASMLHSESAGKLSPLLGAGYRIETSKVTLKMVGHIFEVAPIPSLDTMSDLRLDIGYILENILNRDSLESSQISAKALLGIYALAAMGNISCVKQFVMKIENLDLPWLSESIYKDLCRLKDIWKKDNILYQTEFCFLRLEELLMLMRLNNEKRQPDLSCSS
jgi:hypothetical protein